MENEIENKTFESIEGKIIPESLMLRVLENEISFEVQTAQGRQWYKSTEKQTVSKTLSLFGLSRKELTNQIKSNKATENGVLEFVRQNIADKDRLLVFLQDSNTDLANVVTKRHKQLPLKDIFETVKEVANDAGFKIASITENTNSYQIHMESGSSNMMQSTIDVHLGRNDSRGRAGIHIQGSGKIFVCSNMIVANVDRDVMARAEELGVEVPNKQKLIHTSNIGQRFKEAVQQQMIEAKKASVLLEKKLQEAQKIKMTREEQLKCIELVAEKHNLGNKWIRQLTYDLYEEDRKEPEFAETLYQLSQVFTYVGSHYEHGAEQVRDKLCKIGGQVVILGDKFAQLMKEQVEKNREVAVATSF